MALHTELPIYKKGSELLGLALKAQANMPRELKRSLGEKICQHCADMLDLMALANATQRGERACHIEALLSRHRALTVLLRVSHDNRWLSNALWAQSIELLGSIGKQGGGWLKSVHNNTAPAA